MLFSFSPTAVSQMATVIKSFRAEREKLKQALDAENNLLGNHRAASVIAKLRNSLNEVCNNLVSSLLCVQVFGVEVAGTRSVTIAAFLTIFEENLIIYIMDVWTYCWGRRR